jgi:hypothetical protein
LSRQKEIDDLRGRQEKAQEKRDELGDAQGDAWKDLKSGLEPAWDDPETSMRSAADRFG